MKRENKTNGKGCMKKYFYFILLILFVLLLSRHLVVEAASTTSEVIINEIMYNPDGADDGHEWIEIINVSSSISYIIDSNWRFNDGSNHQLSLIQGDEIIVSGEYYVLTDDSDVFLQEYPDFSGNLIDTVMSLNNTGDTLSLSFDSGQTFFATTTYQSVWGGDGNNLSLERVIFSDSWQESTQMGGSPGDINQLLIAETPTTTEEIGNSPTSTDNEISSSTEEILDQDSNANSSLISTSTDQLSANSIISYSDQIIINEILPNPSGTDSDEEFIELFNRDSAPIDLAGWRLSDSTDNIYQINKNDYATTTIPAYGYFVVYRTQSGIALNNNGDLVKLFQPDNNLLYSIEYQSADEGFTYNKIGADWQWSYQPSPGQANLIIEEPQTKIIYETRYKYVTKEVDEPSTAPDLKEDNFDLSNYQGLRINEFFPNPEGSDDFEWIELYNNSTATLELAGLKLDDDEGGSKVYTFGSSTIGALDFLVINKEESKISLNNSGDKVRLLSPNDEILKEVEYYKSQENQTYNYDEINDEWFWSASTTAGFPNSLPELEVNHNDDVVATAAVQDDFTYNTIADIKTLAKGEKVKTSGILVSPPLVLSKNSIYISQPNLASGIQLYSSSLDFSQYRIGQIIEVAGKVSEIQGEKRINLDKDYGIAIAGTTEINPIPFIEIGDITDDYVGNLISINGELVEKKGSNYYLDDGTGELRIYIKKDTGINKIEAEEGYVMQVSGLLSLTKSGYRLLPRFQADINIGQVLGEQESVEQVEEIIQVEVKNKSKPVNKILIYGGSGLVIILLVLIIKLKFK